MYSVVSNKSIHIGSFFFFFYLWLNETSATPWWKHHCCIWSLVKRVLRGNSPSVKRQIHLLSTLSCREILITKYCSGLFRAPCCISLRYALLYLLNNETHCFNTGSCTFEKKSTTRKRDRCITKGTEDAEILRCVWESLFARHIILN